MHLRPLVIKATFWQKPLRAAGPWPFATPALVASLFVSVFVGLGLTSGASQAQGLEPVNVLGTLIAPPPPKPLRLRLYSLVSAPLPAAKRAPALVLLLPLDEGAPQPAPTAIAATSSPNQEPAFQEPSSQATQAPAATLSFKESEQPASALPLPQPKPFKVAALVGLQPKETQLSSGASPAGLVAPASPSSAALMGDLDAVAVAGQEGDEAYVEVVYVTKQRPLPKDPLQRAARRFVDLIDPSANQIRVKQTRRVASAPPSPVVSKARIPAQPSSSETRSVPANPMPAADDKCLRDLARMNVVFEPLSAFQNEDGCGMSDGVAISRIGSVAIKPAAKLNCGYAKRLVKWVEGDLSQTVARSTGSQLTAIRHYSAYRCSFRSKGRLSEHASGNALDIGALETSGDLTLNVKKDWGDHLDWALMEPMEMAPKSQRPSLDVTADSDPSGNAKRRAWHAITKSACRAFKLVLTPHSNKAHANHLHVDMGRWEQCEL